MFQSRYSPSPTALRKLPKLCFGTFLCKHCKTEEKISNTTIVAEIVVQDFSIQCVIPVSPSRDPCRRIGDVLVIGTLLWWELSVHTPVCNFSA